MFEVTGWRQDNSSISDVDHSNGLTLPSDSRLDNTLRAEDVFNDTRGLWRFGMNKKCDCAVQEPRDFATGARAWLTVSRETRSTSAKKIDLVSTTGSKYPALVKSPLVCRCRPTRHIRMRWIRVQAWSKRTFGRPY